MSHGAGDIDHIPSDDIVLKRELGAGGPRNGHIKSIESAETPAAWMVSALIQASGLIPE
ncbi:MAG: hypothetical protein IIB38_13090 [Candidatus Hydrogenedentes bacterium]|nr:hypothetical protein [Candidatus Hydrogenedentota bacterium]